MKKKNVRKIELDDGKGMFDGINYFGILSMLFVLLIVSFFISQVFKLNYKPVKTETAYLTEVKKEIGTKAFVVRDEKIIENANAGSAVPLVKDGARVSAGNTIAIIFESEDAAKAYMRMNEVDDEIKYYETLQKRTSVGTATPVELNENIYKKAEQLIISENRIEKNSEKVLRENLRNAFNDKQIISGTKFEVSEKLSILKAEKAELQRSGQSYKKINIDRAGYYISTLDGLENEVDYNKVSDISKQRLEELLSKNIVLSSGKIGKIVESFNWYIISSVPRNDFEGLVVGDTVGIKFFNKSSRDVPAVIEKIVNNGDNTNTVCFKASVMDEDLARVRNEEIKISTKKISGIRFKKSALKQNEEGKMGVYVLTGDIIRFRLVNLVYTDDIYAVSNTPTVDENGKAVKENTYVSNYDEVIVEGKDLYDGRVID